MAVATKKKRSKPARKPTGRSKKVIAQSKRPAASKNGAAVKSAGADKFAANQPPLTGIEDVDERIPALDEVCQRAQSSW